MHAWGMAHHVRSCVRLNGRFATLCLLPFHAAVLSRRAFGFFFSDSAPSAEGCTMKMRTCRTLRKLSTSGASAWRRSSSVTLTAQNMSSFWMEEVKKKRERRHVVHGFYSRGPPENASVRYFFIIFAEFSYEYVQREALRVPLIFKEKDGLGIR